MIRSVEIKGFRGILDGKLAQLSPLVVLVGPNGSGKSTVIEATLIGASPNPGDAVAGVFRRHEAGGPGLRWLLWRAGRIEPAELTITTNSKVSRKSELRLARGVSEPQCQLNLSVFDERSSNCRRTRDTITSVGCMAGCRVAGRLAPGNQ